MAILGIDLGTSSVKVTILDTQGHTLSSSKASYTVTSPQPGWSESDPDAWWSATVSAVQSAIAQAPQADITAIGLSGQMHGVVITNAQGLPIRPAMLWADTRAYAITPLHHTIAQRAYTIAPLHHTIAQRAYTIAPLHHTIAPLHHTIAQRAYTIAPLHHTIAPIAQYQNLSPALLEQLANPLVPGMAGPLLLWLAQYEPLSYAKARWALQPKDWLRFRLTDAVATDPSDASATLLYDLQADGWADDVIATLHLQRSLLPPIIPSGAIAGRLSTGAAKVLGLPVGLPVATGAADTAAAMLGTGLLSPGPIQLTLGTGAQLVQLRSKPVTDQTRRTHLYRAADGVNWYTMAAVQNAGLALNWVREMLNVTWDTVYASAAAIPPGADGLLFLPYLTQERPHHPAPSSTGAFLGLRIDHRREHLLHAALEGIAFGIRVALEALPDTHTTRTLRLAGGGSEHPAWRQMLADILNRELLTLDTPAASARGAALLGGIADGIWASAQETAKIAPDVSPVASPDAKNVAIYNELYKNYVSSIKAR